jgi:hypothetical protein
MPLSKREIDELLRLVRLTKEDELNCEECLALIAEFVEQQVAGKPLAEIQQAVDQHLSLCGECREEYEMLQRALAKLGENDGV